MGICIYISSIIGSPCVHWCCWGRSCQFDHNKRPPSKESPEECPDSSRWATKLSYVISELFDWCRPSRHSQSSLSCSLLGPLPSQSSTSSWKEWKCCLWNSYFWLVLGVMIWPASLLLYYGSYSIRIILRTLLFCSVLWFMCFFH